MSYLLFPEIAKSLVALVGTLFVFAMTILFTAKLHPFLPKIRFLLSVNR